MVAMLRGPRHAPALLVPNSLTSHALYRCMTLSLWQWRSFSLSTARACSNAPGAPVCFVLTALARFALCTGSLWCNSSWALLDDALTTMTAMTASAIDLALWNFIVDRAYSKHL